MSLSECVPLIWTVPAEATPARKLSVASAMIMVRNRRIEASCLIYPCRPPRCRLEGHDKNTSATSSRVRAAPPVPRREYATAVHRRHALSGLRLPSILIEGFAGPLRELVPVVLGKV